MNEDFKPDVFKPENEHWLDGIQTSHGDHRDMGSPVTGSTSQRSTTRSGQQLWRFDAPIARLTLTVDTGSVYFHTGGVHREPRPPDRRERVAAGQRARVHITDDHARPQPWFPTRMFFSMDTMAESWRWHEKTGGSCGSRPSPSGHVSPGDVLVIDDLVWSGGRGNDKFIGKDIHTGEVKVEFSPPRHDLVSSALLPARRARRVTCWHHAQGLRSPM